MDVFEITGLICTSLCIVFARSMDESRTLVALAIEPPPRLRVRWSPHCARCCDISRTSMYPALRQASRTFTTSPYATL